MIKGNDMETLLQVHQVAWCSRTIAAVDRYWARGWIKQETVREKIMDDMGQKKAPLHEKINGPWSSWRDTQWGPYKKSALIAMYHNVAAVTTNKLSEIMRLLTKLIKQAWHWFTGPDCRYEEYKCCDHAADNDDKERQGTRTDIRATLPQSEKKPGGWIYWRGGHGMEEKLLEVSMVAARLSLDSSTIRRMFHKGILKGFLTGSELKTIRIYESSVMQHIKGNAQTNNTGKWSR
jgi:hypothetical protein